MLPWQLSQCKVYHYVTKRKQVIPSWELVTQVRIYWNKTRRTNQILSSSKLDVFARLFIVNTAG